jgi:hypothetical protein
LSSHDPSAKRHQGGTSRVETLRRLRKLGIPLFPLREFVKRTTPCSSSSFTTTRPAATGRRRSRSRGATLRGSLGHRGARGDAQAHEAFLEDKLYEVR